MELNRETFDRLFGFEIEAQEVFTRYGDEYRPVKGKRALVRTDSGVALGVVTPSYGIIQPSAGMRLLDAAAGDGAVTYVNGGSFDDGRRLYLQAQLTGASFDVAGQEHTPYLLLGCHNDGGGSYFIALTPTRLFCMNQLRVAIRKIIARFSIRHTRNAAERMELATEVIARSRAYFGAFHVQALQLVASRFAVQDMRALTEELWPTPKAENLIEGVKQTRAHVVRLFTDGKLNAGIHGTRYGAFNAVAEYVDHHVNRRGGEAGRVKALLFSHEADALKQRAFDRLAA